MNKAISQNNKLVVALLALVAVCLLSNIYLIRKTRELMTELYVVNSNINDLAATVGYNKDVVSKGTLFDEVKNNSNSINQICNKVGCYSPY